jgi:hypothetical protein
MGTNVDLLAGWRFWEVAGRDLAALHARYSVPLLCEDERTRLMAENVLLT